MLRPTFPPSRTRVARVALLGLAGSILALGLVACGGDDEGSSGDDGTRTPVSGSTYRTATSTSGSGVATAAATTTSDSATTAQGDAIAHGALITQTDLPGTGWSVSYEDDFEASLLTLDDAGYEDTAACDNYVRTITNAAEQANQTRAGRASRGFERANDLFGTSVDIEVAVYRDSKVASDLVSEVKKAFSAADFENCFRELLLNSEEELSADVQVTMKAGRPMATVPHSGLAQAFDLGLTTFGFTFALRVELYAWADDKATAGVAIFGTPDTITSELVRTAVDKTNSKLSAAQ